MYMFESLINNTYQCFRTIKKMWTRLPNEVLYPINNTLSYGDIFIPIGVNANGVQYLSIGGDCSHTYIVGQLKQEVESQL